MALDSHISGVKRSRSSADPVDGAGDAEHPDAGDMRRVPWSVDGAGDAVDGYEWQ